MPVRMCFNSEHFSFFFFEIILGVDISGVTGNNFISANALQKHFLLSTLSTFWCRPRDNVWTPYHLAPLSFRKEICRTIQCIEGENRFGRTQTNNTWGRMRSFCLPHVVVPVFHAVLFLCQLMYSFIRQKHEQALIVYTCAHVTALKWEQGMPGGSVEYWLTDIYPNGSRIHSDFNRHRRISSFPNMKFTSERAHAHTPIPPPERIKIRANVNKHTEQQNGGEFWRFRVLPVKAAADTQMP